MIDPVNGGMRGAPKFPQPMMLEFLWRAGQRMNDRRYFEAVELTLTRIGEAAFTIISAAAFRATRSTSGSCRTSRRCSTTTRCCSNCSRWPTSARPMAYSASAHARPWRGSREVTAPEGAFCASLDADSEGEEGSSTSGRSPRSRRCSARTMPNFCCAYDVTVQGNFEGHNIPNRLKHLPRSMEDEARLAPMREKLLAARARGSAGPRRQGLADWNGLMIAALVTASLAFEEPAWLAMAARLPCASTPRWRTATGSDIPGAPAGSSFGPCLRSRRHDPRGASRSTKRPATTLISSGRWPGRARSTATTPIPTMAGTSSPPTTPATWWCGPRHHRRRDPERKHWRRRT